MIPREILEKVRRIEIRTRRSATDLLAGEYHSVFKGQGMEFSEVRPYVPGDDVRSIDWNVTARTGDPHIKTYVEERELTVIFLVDVSASGTFGTVSQAKGELAAEAAAVLAFSAVSNNDRIGLISFTDRIEQFIPAKKGRRHVLRLVRDMLYQRPVSKGTNIAAALEYLMRVQRRRAIVFLLSDFYDKDYGRALSMAARRHDVVAVSLSDPRDGDFPDVGLVALEDPETGGSMLVDTSDPAFRQRLAQHRSEELGTRQRLFRRAGVDEIQLCTDRPYEAEFNRFFRRRIQRMAH